MNENEMLEMLKRLEAIITESHIVYTSGRHGSAYVNKDAIYLHTQETSKLCEQMASFYSNYEIDVIAGPTVGGVILSQWVAYYLSSKRGKEVLSVFAEEDENKNRIFKRGYDKLIANKKVLIVEDILTTGGSVKKMVEAVRALGGEVVGCVAICNRGDVGSADIGGAPIRSLTSVKLDSWEEADCPLCKEGRPINTNVGKGRDYLKKKGL